MPSEDEFGKSKFIKKNNFKIRVRIKVGV